MTNKNGHYLVTNNEKPTFVKEGTYIGAFHGNEFEGFFHDTIYMDYFENSVNTSYVTYSLKEIEQYYFNKDTFFKEVLAEGNIHGHFSVYNK